MAGVTVTAGERRSGTDRRPVTNRLQALSRAVEQTRARPQVDIRQALLVIGAVLMGLGLVAIILGWYGASHSAYLFQEIPYLISGGMLGVALVAGGGFLFFAAWIVRMSQENRRYAQRLAQTLDRVDTLVLSLTDAGADPGAGTDADPGAGEPPAAPDAPPGATGTGTAAGAPAGGFGTGGFGTGGFGTGGFGTGGGDHGRFRR